MKEMTNQQKRIAIAKDVVRRLRYLRVEANNTYLDNQDRVLNDTNTNKEISPLVCKLEKNCEVCALGGMFLSHLRLFNNFKYDGYYLGRSDMTNKALIYFTNNQLNLIERYFESPPNNYKHFQKHPKTRLRAIMLNIIKNKGEFKPETETI